MSSYNCVQKQSSKVFRCLQCNTSINLFFLSFFYLFFHYLVCHHTTVFKNNPSKVFRCLQCNTSINLFFISFLLYSSVNFFLLHSVHLYVYSVILCISGPVFIYLFIYLCTYVLIYSLSNCFSNNSVCILYFIFF